MEAGKLYVKIGVDMAALKAGLAEAKGRLAKFGTEAEDIGGKLSTSLSLPLAAAGGFAIKLAGDMEKASLSFRVLLKDAKAALALQGELVKFSAQTPFEFKDVQKGAKQLLAYGFAVGDVTKYLRTAGDLAAGMDVNITEVTSSLGRLKSGNFGEAFERLRELGIDRTALEGQGLKFDKQGSYVGSVKTAMEAVEKVIKDKFGGMTEALSASLPGMLATAWDSIQLFLADIGTSIASSFDLKGILGSFSGALDSLKAGFGNLSPTVQKFIFGLGGLAIAIPPILAGLGFLTTTIIPAVVAGFGLIISPIGLAAAAVATAVGLIIYHWDFLKETLGNTSFFVAIKDGIKSALGIIISVFGVFANLLQGDWSNMWQHMGNIVSYTWNGIISTVQLALSALSNAFTGVFSLVAADNGKKMQVFFDKGISSLNSFKAAVPPLTNALAGVGGAYNKLKDIVTKFGNNGSDSTDKVTKATDRLKMALDAVKAKYAEIAGAGGNSALANNTSTLGPKASILGFQTNKPSSLSVPGINMSELSNALKNSENQAIEQLRQGNLQQELEQSRDALKSTFEGFFTGWNIEGMQAEAKRLIGAIDNLSGTAIKKLKNFALMVEPLTATIASAFENFGAAIGKGENPFKAFGQSLLQGFGDMLIMVGREMLKQAIVLTGLAVATGGALSPIALRTGLAGGALIAAGGLAKSASRPKSYASGYGAAYRNTTVMIGDHNNASQDNPEYVLRQDQVEAKLNRAADNAGGGGGRLMGTVRILGRDLEIALQRQNDFVTSLG